MDNFKDFQQDYGILVEAGFVAIKQGDEDSAVKLLNAAKILRPDHTASDLGFGYIALSKLDLVNAIQTFYKIVQKEPTNYLAKTFLGLCLMLSKSDVEAGNNLVNEALSKSSDASVQSFAQTVLAWKSEYFSKKDLAAPVK